MTNTNLMADTEEAKTQLSTQQKKLEDIKNSVISGESQVDGAVDQKQVDEVVDKVYDDQGELQEDIEVGNNEENEDADIEEEDADGEEEDVDGEVEEEEDYEELEEEMEEDQDYESSTADYEDTPGSSTSSSFAAYTDQEMNQKSQR